VGKGDRVANYVRTLRRDLLKVSETCGVPHPALIGPRSIEVVDTLAAGHLLDRIYGYEPGWGYPSQADRDQITAIMERVDEEEAGTEGPPETAEYGERGDDMGGEVPPAGS
jgi:glutamate synthase (ferredoxin)